MSEQYPACVRCGYCCPSDPLSKNAKTKKEQNLSLAVLKPSSKIKENKTQYPECSKNDEEKTNRS